MYNHQQDSIWLGQGMDISAALDPIVTLATNFRPGYQPMNVSTIYALITAVNTVAITVLTIKFRPLIASAAGEVVIGTLSIPINAAIGNVYYKRVDNVKCTPGGEVVVQTDGGGTVGTASVGIMANPTWDSPGNNAKMFASA